MSSIETLAFIVVFVIVVALLIAHRCRSPRWCGHGDRSAFVRAPIIIRSVNCIEG
jgi:hypothetical protein